MLNLWGSGRYERNVKQQNTHQPNVFSSIRVNDKLVSSLPFLLPFFWKNYVFIINIFIWFNRQMIGWRFEMHTFVFQACSNCCTARCSYHATCKVHKSTNAIAWMNCTQRFTYDYQNNKSSVKKWTMTSCTVDDDSSNVVYFIK